jgi:hypothetical protein
MVILSTKSYLGLRGVVGACGVSGSSSEHGGSARVFQVHDRWSRVRFIASSRTYALFALEEFRRIFETTNFRLNIRNIARSHLTSKSLIWYLMLVTHGEDRKCPLAGFVVALVLKLSGQRSQPADAWRVHSNFCAALSCRREFVVFVPATTKEAHDRCCCCCIVVKAFCLYAKCLTQILPSTNSYLPDTNPSIGHHPSKSFLKNEHGCYLPGQTLLWRSWSDLAAQINLDRAHTFVY